MKDLHRQILCTMNELAERFPNKELHLIVAEYDTPSGKLHVAQGTLLANPANLKTLLNHCLASLNDVPLASYRLDPPSKRRS